MYKALGAIMMCTASFGMILKLVRFSGEKYTNLTEMIKAVIQIRQELTFNASELFRILEKASQKTEGGVSEALAECSQKLESDRSADFKTIWQTATEGKTLFSQQAERVVQELAENLGKMSMEAEVENLEKAKNLLTQIESEERIKTQNDKKVIYTVGGAATAALFILMI